MARFQEALSRHGLAAIAEVKRRSPSAGDLRLDADPAALAAGFERSGAAAVSVLVDERFGGDISDLQAARSAAGLPLLAKGFFSTEDELVELREAGADAVLLLLRDLDDESARRLQTRARALGMDALVEAHDEGELARAVALDADPIGINARDLATFAVDRRAQLELVTTAPRGRTIVAESGIATRLHGLEAELAGADAILVGSALMRAPDPAAELASLIARPLAKVCGLTRQEDVDAAVGAGADLCGFVLVPESPRAADGVLEVGDSALSVAVLVGEPEEHGADLVQVYERERGLVRGRDAVLLRNGAQVATVIDLPWHADDSTHMQRARAVEGRLMLAGGLGPGNVADAIAACNPWAVDASSSLESAPGVKDHRLVREFVEAAQRPVRASGPGEGVRGNFEAEDRCGSKAASVGTRRGRGVEGVNREVPPKGAECR